MWWSRDWVCSSVSAHYSFTDSRVAAADASSDVAAALALAAADGGDSVSEATLPVWLFRLYQSATIPLSVDWLEHWLVCRAPSLLRQLAPLLLLLLPPLLLLPALLLLTEMIECGRFVIDSNSEGNATMELRNLGAADEREGGKSALVKKKKKFTKNLLDVKEILQEITFVFLGSEKSAVRVISSTCASDVQPANTSCAALRFFSEFESTKGRNFLRQALI